MILFTPQQVQEILDILEYHFLFTISTNFGVEPLNKQELDHLSSFGINIKEITKDLTQYDKMYLLGKLTGILKENQVNTLEYSDFLKYIKTGQYQPLSKLEKYQLEIAKRKSYVHLKGLKEKAKQQFESTIIGEEAKLMPRYTETVKEGLITGVEKRKSLQSIVSDLGHKMNEWGHDWGRIVSTEMQDIYNKGRLQEFKEKGGKESLVIKKTYPKACRHCIRLHLTNGIGSKPIIFTIEQLEANGSNIGRKVQDWKATVGPEHPYCRCDIQNVPPGYVWDEEKQDFVIPKDFERKVERKSKIYIRVGDKEFTV